jgi:hypothetical protein
MQTDVQVIKVTFDEWIELFKGAKECSFSVDERDHSWIFKEAKEYDMPIYQHAGHFLIAYN